jgi:hypothetical protein
MRIFEILKEETLLEFGKKGFPGFGKGIFSQRFYEYFVGKLNDISDAHAREWMTNWLCNLFERDNNKFKANFFKKAVADNKNYNAQPVFEQRHFYYLAQFVKEIEDQHVHDFTRDWLADVAGRTNPNFKASVWDKFCTNGREPPKEISQEPIEEDELDENGGPGYGNRAHGGFGQKFFRKAHYLFVAYQLQHMDDMSVKRHMTNWFAKIFKLDNPTFKAEAFENYASSEPVYSYHRPHAIFQQRHFYFLAHEISEISDIHERTFVCDWVADYIGGTNEYFQTDRWEKYCHLDAEHDERKYVAKRRAKANGEEIKDEPEPEIEMQNESDEPVEKPATGRHS